MYFIHYHPLKHTLRSRSLSDREALPYLNIEAVFLFGFKDAGEEITNMHDVVSVFLSVIIVIGGTYYVYAQNGGKEGFDLFQKYFTLGWVVGIRFTLTLIPVIIVYLAVLEKLGYPDSKVFTALLPTITQFIFFQRLGRHFRDTNVLATGN